MRTKTRALHVMTVSGLILVLVALVLPVESSREFIITTNESKQYSPAIYGDIVVWIDERNGNSDVYGYNLSSKEEFQITTDLEDQRNPAIYEDIVVWEDHRGGRCAIYGYNLSTKEEFPISTGPCWKLDPAIYEDIVVWEDRGREVGIAAYNLSTHEEIPISATPSSKSHPAIYGDIVVWEDEKDHESFIYGYNLSTHEEFKIETSNLFFLPQHNQYTPAIYGDIVVLIEDRYDNIFGYDLSTSEKIPIAKTFRGRCHYRKYSGSCNPAIYKNIVIWVGCRDHNQDIYGYNLSTDQEFQITTDKHCQDSPAIYENTVVWKDERNNNWDIYGADISPPYSLLLSRSEPGVYLSDYFHMGLWTAAIGVISYTIVRFIWYMRKFRYMPGALLQSEGQSKDYRRGTLSALFPIGFVVLFAFIGFITFFDMDRLFGLIYLGFSAASVLNFVWNMKLPYIRVTDNRIVLFENLLRGPRMIEKSAIQEINIIKWTESPYQAELLLSDDKKVKINFSSIKKEDKEELIETLTQIVS